VSEVTELGNLDQNGRKLGFNTRLTRYIVAILNKKPKVFFKYQFKTVWRIFYNV